MQKEERKKKPHNPTTIIPRSSVGKESSCNAGRFDSWVGKIPW